MFSVTDDLFAGVPLPGGTDVPWTPDAEDGLPEVDPAAVVAQAAAKVRELLTAPLPEAATKEQLATHRANMASAYQMLAQMAAMAGQQELIRRLPTLKVEQLLDMVKTFAAHGSMVPREDKTAASGFSLNIILPAPDAPGTPAPAPLVTVVETSSTALPET